MRLADFIREHSPQIISEWQRFARTLTPAADSMSPLALRDHIEEILDFISHDIEATQTDADQVKKSQGRKVRHTIPSAAETHASLRHAGGFNMDQMVAEYRALRASVIKLWDEQLTDVTRKDIVDLTRFNEAIDQTLVESIAHYSKKLDHSRSMFLGILSHDLRSPLATARMSAELTLKLGEDKLSERQTMLISQIIDCSDRATDLINYLLDLTHTRLGSGIPIISTAMDMGYIARQLVDEMRTKHPSRTFNLKISGNTEGHWDKPRMGQVFSNLLGNAVQYGFSDAPITVTLTGREREIILTVHNEGVPISESAMNKIFESLVRAEDSKNPMASTNLGIGLYIIREIVEAHKGTIGVTSTEKEGTEFTIRLPRSLKHAAHPTNNTSHLALVSN